MTKIKHVCQCTLSVGNFDAQVKLCIFGLVDSGVVRDHLLTKKDPEREREEFKKS